MSFNFLGHLASYRWSYRFVPLTRNMENSENKTEHHDEPETTNIDSRFRNLTLIILGDQGLRTATRRKRKKPQTTTWRRSDEDPNNQKHPPHWASQNSRLGSNKEHSWHRKDKMQRRENPDRYLKKMEVQFYYGTNMILRVVIRGLPIQTTPT